MRGRPRPCKPCRHHWWCLQRIISSSLATVWCEGSRLTSNEQTEFTFILLKMEAIWLLGISEIMETTDYLQLLGYQVGQGSARQPLTPALLHSAQRSHKASHFQVSFFFFSSFNLYIASIYCLQNSLCGLFVGGLKEISHTHTHVFMQSGAQMSYRFDKLLVRIHLPPLVVITDRCDVCDVSRPGGSRHDGVARTTGSVWRRWSL